MLRLPRRPHPHRCQNDYEWKWAASMAQNFPPAKPSANSLNMQTVSKKVDPGETPVMMYCTGGIRCELYSSILMERGFESVYQLNGGVIGYGLEEGNTHWLGNSFVFDDRLTVPIATDAEAPVIGTCKLCGTPIESYYNCANIDCNELFLACPTCVDEHQGCCCKECVEAPRRRPYHKEEAHKPFKRWYHYVDEGTKGAKRT